MDYKFQVVLVILPALFALLFLIRSRKLKNNYILNIGSVVVTVVAIGFVANLVFFIYANCLNLCGKFCLAWKLSSFHGGGKQSRR